MKFLPYMDVMIGMMGEDNPPWLGGGNSIDEKVERMRNSREDLQSTTAEDHGYDLVAWHHCLVNCTRPAFSPDISNSKTTVSDQYIKRLTIEDLENRLAEYQAVANTPERLRLVELARQKDREEAAQKDTQN